MPEDAYESIDDFSGSALPNPSVLNFPMGGVISFGESMTSDGPTVYLSLASHGQKPSLIFWVDPISFQPVVTTYNRTDGHMTYPLDKIMRSPQAGKPGIPFE